MRVSIIGAGVVGDATGKGLQHFGHQVVFHDIDDQKLLNLAKQGYVVAETLETLRGCTIHNICVPTPLEDETYDLAYLKSAVVSLARSLRKTDGYQVIVIRSTLVPHTICREIIPLLQQYSPLELGEDYGLCHNPEFLRQDYALEDFLNAPITVIGEYDLQSGDILSQMYSFSTAPIVRTNIETAEAIKCFSNTYNAMKISFFNQMYLLAGECGLDHEVISSVLQHSALGIRVPSYGTKGGWPFGGACLPKDLAALTTFFRDMGMDSRLFEAVAEINARLEVIEIGRSCYH